MSTFFVTFLMTSLTMSAVIVLLLLLNKWSASKVPAAFRYYMWLIVLLGLLIPFRPAIPVPFEPLKIPITFESAGMPGSTDTAITPAPPAKKPPVSYIFILFSIWIAGTLTVLAFHLRSYRKFISAIRRWGVKPEDSQIYSVMQAIKSDMGLSGKQITVKECMFISSPMLIGFFNPLILLPEKPIPSDELNYIFRHELTHYKRGDLFMNLLVMLVSAIHWFNPFIYLMAKAIRADCEAACDEKVVAGSCTGARRRYGETIIGYIGTKNTGNPILSTYFYGGSDSMKKRLTSIMDTSGKNKWLALLCLMAAMFSTILSGAMVAFANGTVHPQSNYIGEAKAKSIALQHAGITEQQATFLKVHLDSEHHAIVYDIEFYSGNTEYDYEIDAASGIIREFGGDVEYYSIPANTATVPGGIAANSTAQYIGEAKAKSIALQHAGITEQQVTFLKVHLDSEHHAIVYDIEFYSGNTEYDYEIDAISGEIREYDHDRA
jgi:beta-lactamase regulating signal transducer with metallopeptidase domain